MIPVIHLIKIGKQRVEWHDISEVYMISETTGSRLAQKFGMSGKSELAGICLLKVNNRNTRASFEICSVTNKDTRTTPMALFWCLFCYLWASFTPCSSVSIVNFQHVIASWVFRLNVLIQSFSIKKTTQKKIKFFYQKGKKALKLPRKSMHFRPF